MIDIEKLICIIIFYYLLVFQGGNLWQKKETSKMQ